MIVDEIISNLAELCECFFMCDVCVCVCVWMWRVLCLLQFQLLLISRSISKDVPSCLIFFLFFCATSKNSIWYNGGFIFYLLPKRQMFVTYSTINYNVYAHSQHVLNTCTNTFAAYFSSPSWTHYRCVEVTLLTKNKF